ncbi:HAMP domain-containing histidine kinase [Paenibacillus sp. CC-CFT747]|nr:HAMP domain-containing histidine kinase [Paenibacillus sp. CC-CFT747]
MRIEVKDTGTGISKANMKRVMEPFFTTKGSHRHNFGLGLAYCYQVMRKHGGASTLQASRGREQE